MNLEDMPWPAIREACKRSVVVLPIAAIEQHGPHMGVCVDTALVTAVARDAEKQRPTDMLLCPTLCIGSSHHHLAFGATLSINPQTYVQVLVDLLECMYGWGARRICLLNGHGGNITPGRQALTVFNALGRHDVQAALAVYWELAGKAWFGDPPMESPAISHACEYETSAMLHVRPGAVDMSKVSRAKRPPNTDYVCWEDDAPYRGVTMTAPYHYISGNGCSGEPQKATAAKGKHLHEAAVRGLVSFIDSFKSWPPMKDLRS